MAYGTVPFEKRIRDNIRNYRLQHLYKMDLFQEYFKQFAAHYDVDLLITDRHGEKVFSSGNFVDFEPDVVENPGRKLRIEGRTIGHVYYKLERLPEREITPVTTMLELTVDLLEAWGEDSYHRKELAVYADELELAKKADMAPPEEKELHAGREDVLTGVFQKHYFESRMQVIDRSEVAPVAVICANINDWKFVNDHYGDEESDRLIQVIAGILREEAKSDYVIGRTDGDVFYILIPMPEEGEAEDYCRAVEEQCLAFEDKRLAPSVAFGCVYKENVEEHLEEKLSDAEYEMLDRKMSMKQAPGYRERLEKGLR